MQELVVGAAEAATGSVKVNNWVTVFTDGTVTIMSPAAEMGQGSLTSLPLIVAEEMDADWSKVRIVAAPPNNQVYGNPAFRYLQYTAGSATVTGYFTNLRQFGAQVRYVLLDNAAQRWGVPLTEVVSGPGYAEHPKSGRRLSYGEIAAFAKVPTQAPEVQLDPLDKAHFRLIGKDVPRVMCRARSTDRRSTASTFRCRAWFMAQSCANLSIARSRCRSTTAERAPLPACCRSCR
jgi:isoquinoline 1-oxidoreductase beta subunit